MNDRIRISSKLSLVFAVVSVIAIPFGVRTVAADAVEDVLATPNNAAVSLLPACQGIPIATQREALKLVKSEVCTNLVQLLTGIQTGNQIGTDIQALYTDLQTNLSLTPLCAASLMGVFAQRLITGKISAGSCPAGAIDGGATGVFRSSKE
jgi:hypothetical protein